MKEMDATLMMLFWGAERKGHVSTFDKRGLTDGAEWWNGGISLTSGNEHEQQGMNGEVLRVGLQLGVVAAKADGYGTRLCRQLLESPDAVRG